MKILYVVGSMDPASGGVSQFIRNSIPEMAVSGTTCEVVSVDDAAALFLGTDDFPVHALGPAKGPWQYSSKLYPWLLANVSRFNIVIINGLWIYTGYATRKAIKNQQQAAPLLFVMPHGMLDPYFQQAAGRKLKAVRNRLYWHLIESKVINDADGVLFTCQTELELARKSFNKYKPKKEINVGFGITPPPTPTPEMKTAFLEKCPEIFGDTYWLFLGRLHPKKGVDILIKAYAIIAQKAVDEEIAIPKLIIAGPGINTTFGIEMMQLAKSYPQLEGLVLFPGMLTGDSKWGAVYGCEAFILPSHQENFGIAVVEAMACKKAVIISNKINIWKEINNGGGAIVAPDTFEGTSLALQKWLGLPATKRDVMNEKALATFKAHFHIKTSSTFFLNAINSHKQNV